MQSTTPTIGRSLRRFIAPMIFLEDSHIFGTVYTAAPQHPPPPTDLCPTPLPKTSTQYSVKTPQ